MINSVFVGFIVIIYGSNNRIYANRENIYDMWINTNN